MSRLLRAHRGLAALALAGACFGARLALVEGRAERPDSVRSAVLQTAAVGALEPTHGPPRDGTWLARGVVRAVIGADDVRPGTVFVRRWTVYEHCDAVACRPWLRRQAGTGWEEAPLVRVGGAFRAVFNVAEHGCDDAGASDPSGLQRVFEVSVDRSRTHLRAVEVHAGAYQGCGPGGGTGTRLGTVTWEAGYRSSSCSATVVCKLHVDGPRSNGWRPI